jgi:putative heme-binding domain-containing protein
MLSTTANSVKGLRRTVKVGLLAVLVMVPALMAQNNEPKPAKNEFKKSTRPVVKKWKTADFEPFLEDGLVNRNFDRGKLIYKEATCALCHAFKDEGGTVGPVLTEAAGRFGALDVLLHTIEPSKVISDTYVTMVVELDDGKTLTGTVQEFDDYIQIAIDALDPERKVSVDRDRIVSLEKSPVSSMPENLIDAFRPGEILDLVAYILSRGDRNHEMFQPSN